MIHVRRTPCPAQLLTKGAEELAKWKEYKKEGGKRPSFSAYKLAAVRTELEEMYHGKCAYCEAKIGHISPTDVEHWRPKGKIHTSDGSEFEGYWWLAADWENLLPSCPHCNRPTKHKTPSGATTKGKGMRFPLSSRRKKAPRPGSEKREKPLLLHPSDPRPEMAPERHLMLSDDEPGLLTPTPDGTPTGDKMGDASIEVYALNREKLVRERAARQLLVETAIATIRNATVVLDALPPESDAYQLQERIIREQKAVLDDFRVDSAEYLLMVRSLTDEFVAKLES